MLGAGVTGVMLLSGFAMAGPPFQHSEFHAFSTATHVQGGIAGILLGVEVNYGAAPNPQLHDVAPLALSGPYRGTGPENGRGPSPLPSLNPYEVSVCVL